jgi:hypothetical protein
MHAGIQLGALWNLGSDRCSRLMHSSGLFPEGDCSQYLTNLAATAAASGGSVSLLRPEGKSVGVSASAASEDPEEHEEEDH